MRVTRQWTRIKERAVASSTQERHISTERRPQSNHRTPNSTVSPKTSSPSTALWPPKPLHLQVSTFQFRTRKLIKRHNRCIMRSSSMKTAAWIRRCWEAWISLGHYHPAHSITLNYRRLDWARYAQVCTGRIRQTRTPSSRSKILAQPLNHASPISSRLSSWHRAF